MTDEGGDAHNPWRDEQPDPAPWWQKLGYADQDAFWREMQQREEASSRGLRRRRAQASDLPRGGAPERPERPGTRSCQVNVKLTAADHEALVEAARSYGVAVATMAQLLVNRGLEAVARESEGPGSAATSER